MGIDKQGNSKGVLNCNQYKTPHKTNLTFSFIDNRQTGSLLLKVEDNLWLWQPEKREIKWFQLQVYTDEWVNETISQCVYSFRRLLDSLWNQSPTMTTDQGLHLKPSRVAGVTASGYLLHYCLLHYWIITGLIYELNAHRLVFKQLSRPLAGTSEELDSENLLQGFIGMVCKHDKSIHKPVTKDQEQQARLAVYHELLHFTEIQCESEPCLFV